MIDDLLLVLFGRDKSIRIRDQIRVFFVVQISWEFWCVKYVESNDIG